ncbi:MAG: adenylyltransferase/cytidyltransferase family protein [Actinomycetes bacterium]
MRVLGPDDRLPQGVGSAVTVGNFDGLHRGHLWLLRKLRQGAEGLVTAVVTFDVHPLHVLRPVSAPKLLTDTAQRLQRLQASGLVDVCQVLPFDESRRRQSPEDFVREVLVDRLHARRVMVGSDFRFGNARSGGVGTLRQLGEKHEYTVVETPLLTAGLSRDRQTCCSTYIRRLVVEGQVERAGLLLDRLHEAKGRVVATSRPANGRGTPIVVVRVPRDRALPAEGSYAGAISAIDGRERAAGISVRPGITAGQEALLDLHVIDGAPELMDQNVVVRFRRRLWSSSPSDLFAQVGEQDVARGRASADGGWGSVM